jgi:hypothetical protein
MAIFKLGVPVETREPIISVDIDPAAPIRAGQHRFQLIVVDNSGNESDPATASVLIVDREKPTAKIEGPSAVPYNTPFRLSGQGSIDVGGGIVTYRWTLLD